MSTHNPAVLELRQAIRPWLSKLELHEKVLVGVSGGADSLALAFATYLEAKDDFNIIPVVVDHGLQANSAQIAADTVSKLKGFGFTEIFLAKANLIMVDGLEASARRARYQVFEQAIETYGAKLFLLGHTQNDQAESVLLGLARGSGTKSLSGMAEQNGIYVRPFLLLAKELTMAACNELDIEYWSDPHNLNEEFTRVRVRKNILPIMESQIGPGITQALSRSARLLRQDSEALDQMAAEVFADQDPKNLDIEVLAALPKALRSRVIRLAVYAAGAPAGSLSADHLEPLEALVTDWHGQGVTSLPGGVKVGRFSGRLSLS